MTETEFWQLLDEKVDRSDVTELDISQLEQELGSSSTERIAAFGHHFDRLHQSSYRTRLWGAAYLINGGCSDDGFDYFRGWLIGMGRDVFVKAMDNPDTLAEVAEEDVECEDMLSVAYTAYEEVTGAELELAHTPVTAEEDDDWDFDDSDEMRKRFPKLFGRFGSGA